MKIFYFACVSAITPGEFVDLATEINTNLKAVTLFMDWKLVSKITNNQVSKEIFRHKSALKKSKKLMIVRT